VRIGYLTNSIKAGDVLGLTVEGAQEVCEGENFEWIEVNGVGELDAESGLSAQYTAPASGANCPGNAEIWLSCGGEVVATLIITIDYEFAISFLYGDPELEIARNDSLVVSVEANGTPLTWAVSGTGFSLEHAETAGAGNVLHADETACGAATITVTDCDGNQEIGSVRCTTGRWVSKGAICGMAGEVGILSIESWPTLSVTCEKGYQKQANTYKAWDKYQYDWDSCDAAMAKIPNRSQDCLIFTIPCSETGGGSYPVLHNPFICRAVDCVGNGERYAFKIFYHDYKLSDIVLRYYEWGC